jgi:hypothetical protein
MSVTRATRRNIPEDGILHALNVSENAELAKRLSLNLCFLCAAVRAIAWDYISPRSPSLCSAIVL